MVGVDEVGRESGEDERDCVGAGAMPTEADVVVVAGDREVAVGLWW